ncbi:MAG: hypothetical protein JWP81_331 [Ferruginibacter sp.]|nr:hypothetical protein [Ferruginibacter sp.]
MEALFSRGNNISAAQSEFKHGENRNQSLSVKVLVMGCSSFIFPPESIDHMIHINLQEILHRF